MILDFIDDILDGTEWEKICDSCYRMIYQEKGYQKIPATVGGDGGIEGFTHTGIVYQCYCPERKFSDNELYDHLRDKMTKDTNKLVDLKYGKRLKTFGVPIIREWHFVIPQYKDARIIQHAESKKQEILSKKKSNKSYDYIHDDFKIIVKVAEDFKFQISKIIRNNLTDTKLNFAILHTGKVDWSKCDSDKVNNIKRKVKAVMNDLPEEHEDYLEMVDFYLEAYIKGLEILRILRVSYSEIYEDIYALEQSYKREVKIKTKMNTDRSINATILKEILDDFQNKIQQEFKYLSIASMTELKIDLISGWLADCSMEFRSR